MASELPPLAVLVRHRVDDFERWKEAFDEHRPAREAAGVLGHHVQRGIDDPQEVHVYLPATDLEKARAFLASPDLARVMERAGVRGGASTALLRPVTAALDPEAALPGIVVKHAVEDYARWRTAYDDFEAFRLESGIVGHAVDQLVGDPNQLVVYHQGKTVEALRRFVDSTALRHRMEEAGVVGEPDIRFTQAIEGLRYVAAPAARSKSA